MGDLFNGVDGSGSNRRPGFVHAIQNPPDLVQPLVRSERDRRCGSCVLRDAVAGRAGACNRTSPGSPRLGPQFKSPSATVPSNRTTGGLSLEISTFSIFPSRSREFRTARKFKPTPSRSRLEGSDGRKNRIEAGRLPQPEALHDLAKLRHAICGVPDRSRALHSGSRPNRHASRIPVFHAVRKRAVENHSPEQQAVQCAGWFAVLSQTSSGRSGTCIADPRFAGRRAWCTRNSGTRMRTLSPSLSLIHLFPPI